MLSKCSGSGLQHSHLATQLELLRYRQQSNCLLGPLSRNKAFDNSAKTEICEPRQHLFKPDLNKFDFR